MENINQKNQLARILENLDVNYIPSVFKNQAKDLASQAETLGLDKDSLLALNRDRYMRYLEILSTDGLKLSIMPEQTKEMVLTALYQNPSAIKFVIEQDEEICNLVIAAKPELIDYVRNQTEQQIQYVLDKHPHNIRWIKNQTDEWVEYAISKDYSALQHVKKVKPQYIELILDKLKDSIYYSNGILGYSPLTQYQDEDIVEKVLNVNPLHLIYVKPEYIKADYIIKMLDAQIDTIKYLRNKIKISNDEAKFFFDYMLKNYNFSYITILENLLSEAELETIISLTKDDGTYRISTEVLCNNSCQYRATIKGFDNLDYFILLIKKRGVRHVCHQINTSCAKDALKKLIKTNSNFFTVHKSDIKKSFSDKEDYIELKKLHKSTHCKWF